MNNEKILSKKDAVGARDPTESALESMELQEGKVEIESEEDSGSDSDSSSSDSEEELNNKAVAAKEDVEKDDDKV